jgi:hypothetical protein
MSGSMRGVRLFNARLHDELLNETLFTSLNHAREALATWIDDYNTDRQHSSLGNLPPATYAELNASKMQRDGALCYIEGFAPAPLHHRAIKAQMKPGLHSSPDEMKGSDQNELGASA